MSQNMTGNDRPIFPCLHDMLATQGERFPDRIAILGIDAPPLTYAGLYKHVCTIAGQLNAMGLGPNDRIAVVLPNGPELASSFLAIAAGAAFAPLNPAYRTEEFEFFLDDLVPGALIVLEGGDSPAIAVARARGIPIIALKTMPECGAGVFTLKSDLPQAPCQPRFSAADDVGLVLHTSGTTSRPKMVPLTHTNLCLSARNISTALQLTPEDRSLNIMPLFHIHGMMGFLSSMASGASVVCSPGFLAPKFFGWMAEFKPTWYTAVPTMHQSILARAGDNKEIIRQNPLRLVRSASASMPPTVMAGLEAAFGAPVIEAFAMTEATQQMTINPLPPGIRKPGSVGLPSGPEVAIMDAVGDLLPQGATGEIVVKGPTITRGYENNPAANESSFTNGWFRTGDQGYQDGDGYFFITGRIKEVINRGGEKISPREVDEILLTHPAIAQAAAFAVPHYLLGEDIGAAVVLRENTTVTERELREFTAKHLADFKVPYRILMLEEIPKGPTGKLQRIGLAAKLGIGAIEPSATEGAREYAAPRNALETTLAGIWTDVLGVKEIGIHDDFLELGGDSVLAAQVIVRVFDILNVQLTLISLLDSPTIAGMAVAVAECPADLARIPRRPDRKSAPASFGQQRLWFLYQMDPENPLYNSPLKITLTGPLDVAALQNSIDTLIARHEALRTAFAAREGALMQEIMEPRSATITMIDGSGWPESEREARIHSWATDEARRPFDLSGDLLLRAALCRFSANEHVFVLTLHHIAYDGWSRSVILRELSWLYQARTAGAAPPVPDLDIQYGDFSLWQHHWLTDEEQDRQLAYWKPLLADAPPVLNLPTDRPRPRVESYRGAHVPVVLSNSLTESLQTISRRHGVTLFVTLMTAFKTLMLRYTEQKDMIVGTQVAGRSRLETENLIGIFINTLALRTDLSGDPGFDEALKRVRESALGAFTHQDLPFEKLIEHLRPERNLGHGPVIQVLFILQNTPTTTLELPGLAITVDQVDTLTSKFDLTLSLWQGKHGISGWLEFNSDLFDRDSITRMAENFQTLLQGIRENPKEKLSALPLLADAERRVVLEAWNETGMDYPEDLCIHQLFEAQAKRAPDAVAVACNGRRLTYRELDARANKAALELRSMGVGPDSLTGLCMDRSPEMVIGMLGILKAGGAYLPLDPAYPPERLAFMIADSQASVLVTQYALLDRLPEHKARVLLLDEDWNADAAVTEAAAPDSTANPENLAYTIYTSGSTGKPKGVQIPHRAVVNFLESMRREPGLSPEDTLLSVTTVSFDIAALEVFLPLTTGAKLEIVPAEEVFDGPRLISRIADSGATVMQATPATWRLLLSAGWTGKAGLKILCGGEALREDLAASLLPICGSLWNMYGPTETTIWSSVHHVERAGEFPLIGRPIGNTTFYIVSPAMQPVPIGVPGELCIGGDGIARGYINRPDLTVDKFIPNPFATDSASRLYKTGDLARFLPDGNVEFLGRIDHQVKIRGFRIELSEVEGALAQHPAVAEAVVTAQPDRDGGNRLVAYITEASGEKIPPVAELREFLKQSLPGYMTPSVFMTLESFPKTANGKLDRKRLPKPGEERPDVDQMAAGPRDALELQVIRIWEQVIGVYPIGATDSFFDLGGHSLMAIRLFAEIEKQFGVSLSLATVFSAPTVTQMAALLREDDALTWRSPVVAVQPRGSRPPLWCAPVAGGSAFYYRPLSGYLGPDQPLYTFEPRGMDGRTAPIDRMEEIAAFYVKYLREIQPNGPYYLAGLSRGGTIAFEMAQQLRVAGEEVGILIVLDTVRPGIRHRGKVPGRRHVFDALDGTVQRVRFHLDVLSASSPDERALYLGKRLKKVKHRLKLAPPDKEAEDFLADEALTANLPAGLRAVAEAGADAIEHYTVKPFDGSMLLVRANIQHRDVRRNISLGWEGFALGGLEIVHVPGNHEKTIEEPCVRVSSKYIKDRLMKAQGLEPEENPG